MSSFGKVLSEGIFFSFFFGAFLVQKCNCERFIKHALLNG